MMASTVADNVSTSRAPLAANPGRNPLRLQARMPMIASAYIYTWTSDQFSQYGSKPIPSTVRDATYVLDAILDNETELDIVEHTTDTAGYTEIVFALFDLLGLRFSPRIKGAPDQRLYRPDKQARYRTVEPLLKGTVRTDFILQQYDDLLRIVGSLKSGWVTTSLLMSKLQA